MKGFLLGLAVGIGFMAILNITGWGDIKHWTLFGNNAGVPNAVATQNLVKGATEFGTLKVTVTSGKAVVSGVEVDVGVQPGGKMAVATTDKDGVALWNEMPIGDFVVFFNAYNFPKNFKFESSLTPVSVSADQTTEQKIELTAKE
jgi:hypothetical protein